MTLKKVINRILLFTLGIVLLLVAVNVVLFVEFDNVKQAIFYEGSDKAWSHRGDNRMTGGNTIASTQSALKNGYSGIEVDVWFDTERNKLLASHEYRFDKKTEALVDFFQQFPNEYFWIDLKNLNKNHYDVILNELNSLQKINSNFIVESKNCIPLGALNKEGFNTCLWVASEGKPYFNLFFSKLGLHELFNMYSIAYYDYNAISMPLYRYQNKNVQERFGHLNIHLWTDLSRKDPAYLEMIQHEEIKIILDDEELMDEQ